MKDATMAQGKQLTELLLQANDPYAFAQNLIERWGAVQLIGRGEVTQAQLLEALKHIEITTNPYAGEKVAATYSYPKGYKPNSVEDQVKRLLAVYSWLDASNVDAFAKSWVRVEEADGLYVIPKPTVVGQHLGITEPWDNFGTLTEQGPLAALASTRKFHNFRSGYLDTAYHRLAESAKSALQKLEADQPGDLLVFPAQTGKLYAGHSPRNARWEAEHHNQWPLPAYIVGWMIVANPHRLEQYEHLIVDCIGDEYRLDTGDEFDGVLFFCVHDDDTLCLRNGWFGYGCYDCGGASGFLQQ